MLCRLLEVGSHLLSFYLFLYTRQRIDPFFIRSSSNTRVITMCVHKWCVGARGVHVCVTKERREILRTDCTFVLYSCEQRDLQGSFLFTVRVCWYVECECFTVRGSGTVWSGSWHFLTYVVWGRNLAGLKLDGVSSGSLGWKVLADWPERSSAPFMLLERTSV